MKISLSAILGIALLLGCSQREPEKALPSAAASSSPTTKHDSIRQVLVTRLVRAGDLIASGEHEDELASYFDVAHFTFHGPDGTKTNFAGLSRSFKSWQAAFTERSVKRGIIIQEGEYLACQTFFAGKFVHDFTQSPVGLLKPNGKQVVRTIHNIFRYDQQGRIVEEWVQYDNQNYLQQLGAAKKEP